MGPYAYPVKTALGILWIAAFGIIGTPAAVTVAYPDAPPAVVQHLSDRPVLLLAPPVLPRAPAALPKPPPAVDAAGQALRRPLPGHRDPQVVQPVAFGKQPWDWRYALVDVVQKPNVIQVAFRRGKNSNGIPIIVLVKRWGLPSRKVRLIDPALYRGELGTPLDKDVELWTGQR